MASASRHICILVHSITAVHRHYRHGRGNTICTYAKPVTFCCKYSYRFNSCHSHFLFKKRPTQFKLTLVGLLLSILLIALQVWQIEDFKSNNTIAKANYSWGALLPIALVVLFILAIQGIRKDEKLVKSLDRLR